MALDAAAYTDLRNYIKRRVGHMRYRADGVFTEIQISDVQIRYDGVVRVQAAIVPDGVLTIDRVELYNSASELWAHQDVSITIDREDPAVLYWFDFEIKEVESNA